jgi:hypothetical protein
MKNPPKDKRRYLVLGNTTAKSMYILQSLRKKKDLFDVMIMGRL